MKTAARDTNCIRIHFPLCIFRLRSFRICETVYEYKEILQNLREKKIEPTVTMSK
jgi:hypothetical protein